MSLFEIKVPQHLKLDITIKTESSEDLNKIRALLINIQNQNNSIMSSQAELAAGLQAVTTQIQKIGTESTTTLQKVTDLEAALANQDNVSPEVQTAFDALKQQVQVVDDLIADAPAPTEPTEPTA